MACSGLGRGRFYGRLLWAALACSVFEVPSGLLWLALGSGHLALCAALACSGLEPKNEIQAKPTHHAKHDGVFVVAVALDFILGLPSKQRVPKAS